MTAIDNDKMLYMPLDQIHSAGGIVQHIKNSWWVVDHEKGLLFYARDKRKSLARASPQCNSNKECAEAIAQRIWPGMEIRFFESVLVPVNLQDYR